MPDIFSRLVRSFDRLLGFPLHSRQAESVSEGSFAVGSYSYWGNAKHGKPAFTLDAHLLSEENRTLIICRQAEGSTYETSIKRSGFHEMAQWMSASDYERLFSVNELRQKDLVVDVACGSGDFVRKCLADGIHIEGVDLVLSVEQARKSCFKKGTAWAIPYESGTISVIYETWGPTWLKELKELGHWSSSDVLAEYRRILNPNGLIRLGPVPLEKITAVVAEISGLKISHAAPMDYNRCVYLEIQKE